MVGGSLKAGADVFLPLEAGLAQMHVAVREAGEQNEAARVFSLGVFGSRRFARGGHGYDFAVFAEQVDGGAEVSRVLQKKFHGSSRKIRGLACIRG